MAKARRAARTNTARVLVPVVAGLVLLAGAGVAAWQLWPERSSTSAQPQASVTATAAETTPSPTSATPSPTPSATASETETTDPATLRAQEALEACRAKVAAADAVIDEATTGVDHWEKHVAAQTLADRGEFTVEQMKAQFKETRLKGPGDQKRYRDAVREYENLEGSCDKVSNAPDDIAASLTDCRERRSAQQPVMEAGRDAMKDWANHLADMQRNKVEHVPNPQVVWLRAYRAAPKNINAFNRAIDQYNPPEC